MNVSENIKLKKGSNKCTALGGEELTDYEQLLDDLIERFQESESQTDTEERWLVS